MPLGPAGPWVVRRALLARRGSRVLGRPGAGLRPRLGHGGCMHSLRLHMPDQRWHLRRGWQHHTGWLHAPHGPRPTAPLFAEGDPRRMPLRLRQGL